MSINVVRTLPEQAWRRFVDEHPAGNIFHTPEMFQVFARTKGMRPDLWAVTEGDRIQALFLPVQIALKDGLLRPLTTRAVVYGSVLCIPGNEGLESLAILLQTYTNEVQGNPLFTELRNGSDLSDVQPILNMRGFAYEDHLNYLVDLDRPKDLLWRSIGRNRQKCVRSSKNRGTWVEEVVEPEKVAVAYQVLHDVFKHLRVPLPHSTMFETALRILQPLGMFKLWLAYTGEHPIGVLTVLIYKGRILGWYGGSDRAFSTHNSDSMLIWNALEWGNEHGQRLFDFGGGGKPEVDYGPRDFKARWGGTLVNYGRNIYVHAPIQLELSRVAYELIRKVLLVTGR
jgi:hypothetical protein